MRRRQALRGIGAASTLSITGIAGCTDLFGENITWIIPFSEGGGTDAFAREYQPHIEDHLDETVQIDNVPGAGALNGIDRLHGEDTDGTVFATANTPSWQFAWRSNETIDEENWHPSEFEPIAVSGIFAYVIIVNDSYDIEDFADLRDAYQNGELENFAFQGEDHDTSHVSARLRDDYGLDYDERVPYDGGGEVQERVLSDEIPAGIVTSTSAVSAVEGDARAVVSLVEEDLAAFPDIDQIVNYGDPLDYITNFELTQIAPPDTGESEREELMDAIEYATEQDAVEEWADETGNEVVFRDIEGAAQSLDGVVETLEDNINFDDF